MLQDFFCYLVTRKPKSAVIYVQDNSTHVERGPVSEKHSPSPSAMLQIEPRDEFFEQFPLPEKLNDEPKEEPKAQLPPRAPPGIESQLVTVQKEEEFDLAFSDGGDSRPASSQRVQEPDEVVSTGRVKKSFSSYVLDE